MFKVISTYADTSYEFNQLQIAAEMFTAKSKHGFRYYVADVYFDAGRDWMWTTILCINDAALMRTTQAITPAQQEQIIFSKDLDATTNEIINDKYWVD